MIQIDKSVAIQFKGVEYQLHVDIIESDDDNKEYIDILLTRTDSGQKWHGRHSQKCTR